MLIRYVSRQEVTRCLADKVIFLYCQINTDAINATAAVGVTTTATTILLLLQVHGDRQANLALIPRYTITTSHKVCNAVLRHRE
jgi:hypothetical protein